MLLFGDPVQRSPVTTQVRGCEEHTELSTRNSVMAKKLAGLGVRNRGLQNRIRPISELCRLCRVVTFFFPYSPPLSRQTPPPFNPRELDFGPFRSVSVCFGSVLGPFRVSLGVLGRVGVGSLRAGSVREKNITSVEAGRVFSVHVNPSWHAGVS